MNWIRMAMLGFLVFMMFTYAYADVLLGITAKYGPNGYDLSGTQSTSTTNTINTKPHKTTSSSSVTTINGVDVDNRYQLVPGLTLQTIPEWGGISYGAGVYMDMTATLFLGLRL